MQPDTLPTRVQSMVRVRNFVICSSLCLFAFVAGYLIHQTNVSLGPSAVLARPDIKGLDEAVEFRKSFHPFHAMHRPRTLWDI